jgi:hypothetical protein
MDNAFILSGCSFPLRRQFSSVESFQRIDRRGLPQRELAAQQRTDAQDYRQIELAVLWLCVDSVQERLNLPLRR